MFQIYDVPCNVAKLHTFLWAIDRCYSDEILSRLQKIIQNPNNRFFPSGIDNRLELTNDSEDMDFCRDIHKQQCKQISSLVALPLVLRSVKYWIDLPGFACAEHSDHQDIAVTYQIYIYCAIDKNIRVNGTKFVHQIPAITLPFVPNTGYINVNSDQKRHLVEPGNGLRTSVNFQYLIL